MAWDLTHPHDREGWRNNPLILLTKGLSDRPDKMTDRNLSLVHCGSLFYCCTQSELSGKHLHWRLCVAIWIVLSSKEAHEYLLFPLENTKLIKKLIRREFSSFIFSDDTWAMRQVSLAFVTGGDRCLRSNYCAHLYYAQYFRRWNCGWNITGLNT